MKTLLMLKVLAVMPVLMYLVGDYEHVADYDEYGEDHGGYDSSSHGVQ